nr:immunoglobulin heavy chain junction region [Macaca mulatta]
CAKDSLYYYSGRYYDWYFDYW